MWKNKTLVIATLAIASLVMGFGVYDGTKPKHKQIDTRGQMTLGNKRSDVHVIVFLDFKCYACKRFEEQIFPLLERRYIKTDKIAYTLIPISFLSGSSHLLEGYYCTREQNRDASLTYISKTFDTQSLPVLEGIDREKLYECLGSESASNYVDRNLDIAKQAMGRTLETPTIFVNGYRVKEPSYTAVSNAIDQALSGDTL
ncbi:MAG: thioredoxin domain-containing protein [Chlamydiia bacterium]|nr:thioredoxin domain-containing protein [Chlamydiia bacterium]MCP5491843.1 thioredoxin domain-containing protein [Chlamydiales bacterium]